MIIPMLMKIDLAALLEARAHWRRGIGVTLFVNWAVKPFCMALLAGCSSAACSPPYLPTVHLDSYVAGLILLAAAPCTAMVFVCSRLSNGDPYFTLTQVALNDTIMIFAFAPIVGLLLGLSAITVPWDTPFISVVMNIIIPVAIAQAWRKHLRCQGQARFDAVLTTLGHASILALLATFVLLFAFQGEAILKQPLIIALLAMSILIQVFYNSAWPIGSTAGWASSTAWPGPRPRSAPSTSSSWRWRRPSRCSVSTRGRPTPPGWAC